MKIITKNTDYAIRALIELGIATDGYLSVRYISEKQKIPYPYLRRIFHTLLENKVVVSKEGGRGGFRLSAQPEKIKISDIIQIFQGPIQISECLFRKKICHNRETCVLRDNLLEIEKSITKKFASLTIGKLIQEQRGKS